MMSERRSMKIPVVNLVLEFYNRVIEPLSFSMICYFLEEMQKWVINRFVGVYTGEIENVLTHNIVWIRFRLRQGVTNRLQEPSRR